MGLENKYKKYTLLSFWVIAISLVIYVLYIYPQPGVADQGDFDRVMGPAGIELLDSDKNNPDFKRFFQYTVTDYKIVDLNSHQMLLGFSTSSMVYLIRFICIICRLFRQGIFKTGYLAAVYAVIYIFSIFKILRCMTYKNKISLLVTVLLSIFVFFDGNYLVWFNSLYGEPMMISTLLLYGAAWLHYIYYVKGLKRDNKLFLRIMFIIIAAFLFLGSKLQVITALPVIMVMVGGVLWDNRAKLKRSEAVLLLGLYILLIIYPIRMNHFSKALSQDTNYNSVFYGILKDSNTPEKDLMDLGLNPDMAIEAGKHSYLPSSEYAKYAPHTAITAQEFYSKMSNVKLVSFYLKHPLRLIKGMQYTAEKAFYTSTGLGKYSRSYSQEPISEFNRFTFWSSIREGKLPRRLSFIILVYILVFSVTLNIYIKNRYKEELKGKIQLLWALMLIGMLQFPMPYVGNGEADTAKQLYLFNFIFDIMLLVSVIWLANKLVSLIEKLKFKNRKYE